MARSKSGHQAFIIYPLVEESEKSELLAATQEHARLQKEIFRKLKLGLLHGRMKPDEKDAVMAAFRDRQYDILVSTTVVEGRCGCAQCHVMLVEGANHFGLAQLHQLRGRLGAPPPSPTVCSSPTMKMPPRTSVCKPWPKPTTASSWPNATCNSAARASSSARASRLRNFPENGQPGRYSDDRKSPPAAQALFARDPDLKNPENSLLAEALGRFWGGGKGDVS